MRCHMERLGRGDVSLVGDGPGDNMGRFFSRREFDHYDSGPATCYR